MLVVIPSFLLLSCSLFRHWSPMHHPLKTCGLFFSNKEGRPSDFSVQLSSSDKEGDIQLARPPPREAIPHPAGSGQRLARATMTRRRAGVVASGGGSHTPGTASSVWHSLPSPHPSFPLSPHGPVLSAQVRVSSAARRVRRRAAGV